MSNLTQVEGMNLVMEAFLVVPEFVNFILLTIGLLEMYQGIEIGHPIYAILFANLLVALSSSFLGIISFFTLKGTPYMQGIFVKDLLLLNYDFWVTIWVYLNVKV